MAKNIVSRYLNTFFEFHDLQYLTNTKGTKGRYVLKIPIHGVQGRSGIHFQTGSVMLQTGQLVEYCARRGYVVGGGGSRFWKESR